MTRKPAETSTKHQRLKEDLISNYQAEGQSILNRFITKSRRQLRLVEIPAPLRQAFDKALDEIHYARSCKRVGRCMRLAICYENQWAGGIVLGSTFPNVEVRDEFVGLKQYVRGYKNRGLKSPWSRENTDYWMRLQRIVNHARTFVFPSFQGRGIGIRAHKLLLTEGIMLWQEKYKDKVAALDTLCDHGDSKLFLVNGWTLAGETKGYCSNPQSTFSKRGDEETPIKNNVALSLHPERRKWVVWVKMIDSKLI
jgi:hypothetical protein